MVRVASDKVHLFITPIGPHGPTWRKRLAAVFDASASMRHPALLRVSRYTIDPDAPIVAEIDLPAPLVAADPRAEAKVRAYANLAAGLAEFTRAHPSARGGWLHPRLVAHSVHHAHVLVPGLWACLNELEMLSARDTSSTHAVDPSPGLAPENAAHGGERGNTSLTDAFLLARSLFEQLAGEDPFGRDAMSRLMNVAQGRASVLADRVPGLPPRLSMLLAQQLDSDPARRTDLDTFGSLLHELAPIA